jgi:preprotein translocase subunit SecG
MTLLLLLLLLLLLVVVVVVVLQSPHCARASTAISQMRRNI